VDDPSEDSSRQDQEIQPGICKEPLQRQIAQQGNPYSAADQSAAEWIKQVQDFLMEVYHSFSVGNHRGETPQVVFAPKLIFKIETEPTTINFDASKTLRDEQPRKKRDILSSVFIAALTAIAFHEAFITIHEVVLQHGISWSLVALSGIFFATSLRFFIGNQVHLINRKILKRGIVWFYDFMVIMLEGIMLIFLGLFISPEFSTGASIGFFDALFFLYTIDIIWILTQWLAGKKFPLWKRETCPWTWAILNIFLILGILLTKWIIGDLYSSLGLLVMFIINVAASIIDLSADTYKILDD
jgi:hypothetical protein